ncbi:hypothetical protein, partial [uncultured Cyclobacterium sp.]|uniref:hypothetical protein n=1 Tax=uncultured Cyclobacterium sp. TaxID=453820 RepID=UPI0030EEDCBF
MKYLHLKLFVFVGLLFGFSQAEGQQLPSNSQRVHQDVPFVQEYAIKYYSEGASRLDKVYADRNGTVQILGQSGL